MVFKVKLLKTIRNNAGDVFRKGSIVMAKKSYGGFTLNKLRKRKTLIQGTTNEYFMCLVSVNRVKEESFEKI